MSIVLRASATDSTDEDEQALKDEARLEALERGVRRKQGDLLMRAHGLSCPSSTLGTHGNMRTALPLHKRSASSRAGAKAVMAQSEQMRRREEARKLQLGGSMAEWKEGKLFPEGWDDMPLQQKVLQ